MTRPPRLAVIAIAGLGAIPLGLSALPATAAEAPTCTRRAGQFAEGTPVKDPVTLAPDPDTQVINFGGRRQPQEVDIVVGIKPPLPPEVTPAMIDIDVPRRLRRIGDTLTTISSQIPMFSEPRINPARSRMSFVACVNGKGLEAGSYVGLITVEGPSGVGPASVTVTANCQGRPPVLDRQPHRPPAGRGLPRVQGEAAHGRS